MFGHDFNWINGSDDVNKDAEDLNIFAMSLCLYKFTPSKHVSLTTKCDLDILSADFVHDRHCITHDDEYFCEITIKSLLALENNHTGIGHG